MRRCGVATASEEGMEGGRVDGDPTARPNSSVRLDPGAALVRHRAETTGKHEKRRGKGVVDDGSILTLLEFSRVAVGTSLHT